MHNVTSLLSGMHRWDVKLVEQNWVEMGACNRCSKTVTSCVRNTVEKHVKTHTNQKHVHT
jgi:hypothetical protein